MYLEEIEIHNWRGIAHQHLTLTPGLNIIHGPNECGKSSWRQAVRAALLQNPGSRAREALASRPWTSGENPRVRVVFWLDGECWTVQKTFLSPTGSQLLRGDSLVASDKAVHDKLTSLLEGSVWMGSLWSEQGDMSLPDVPRNLRGKLAAEEVLSPGLLWLEEQLQSREREYWTPTGRPKKELQQARGETMEAEEKVEAALQELEESDELSEQVTQMRDDLERAKAAEQKLSSELKQMSKRVGAWDRYRGQLGQWEAASEAFLKQAEWLERWETCSFQVATSWKEQQEFQQRLQAIEKSMGQEPSRDQIERLTARLNYLKRLEQKRLQEQLAQLNPPREQQLARLRELENELIRTEAGLQAMALKLSLTAFIPLEPSLEIDGAEVEGGSLKAGKTQSWEAHTKARMILPGVAEITVDGGATEAEELLQRRNKLQQEQAELLAEVGCQSLEQARQRADQSKELKAKIQGKPVSDTELSKLASTLEVSEFETLDLDEIGEAVRTHTSDLEELEFHWGEARKAYQKKRSEYEILLRKDPTAALRGSLEHQRAEAARWPASGSAPEIPALEDLSENWLKNLEKAEELSALRESLETEKAKLIAQKEALKEPEGEEVTPQAIEQKELKQKQLSQQRETLTESLHRHLGRLRERSDGFHTLVTLQEHQAALRKKSRDMELQAAAVQLLLITLREKKAQLQANLVGPLQERVSARLSRLTEGRYRRLNLNQDFVPQAVVPREVESAELADLSFGTREQLLFLTRLCLAEMLSEKHQRQSLVFDDNLVHTDGRRMELALQMLQEAAETSQIIVLTCHPDRYEGVPGAERVELATGQPERI
ncbi:MAG: AAA family ATPase [Vulcanimicrobiota bacterium]